MEQLQNYAILLESLYSQNNIINVCDNKNCNSVSHKVLLEKIYNDFVSSILVIKEKVCSSGTRRGNGKNIPGWNKSVKSYHDDYRLAY